jgi:phenylacetate-coenzyme A ligase PaaK-like adenylate-forming protein
MVFSNMNHSDFDEQALDLFRYQYDGNPVYRMFADLIGKRPAKVKTLMDIPFMPVGFFRDHVIMTGKVRIEAIFESSGTTGMTPSKHYVKDLSMYEESFTAGFRMFYGDPSEYLIAALLPSYTERPGSSLVHMADRLIKMSGHKKSGFYKKPSSGLIRLLRREKDKKVLLMGVSFALLELAEKHEADLSHAVIMETGGMKGRRKELTREELHAILMKRFGIGSVHSEYGMTELFSQAYSKGEGIFHGPPWMKVLLRDPWDPLTLTNKPGKTGGINIIDLANIDSCAFIATGDLGRLHPEGGFEVLGRFDNADIRGCNLLVES